VNTERGYHNRLTHSLKVAQVGKSLAEHLNEQTDDEIIDEAGGLDKYVVETACLAHDLGHPPFGHPAEEAIQAKLENKGVPDSFEGNPQSFRIVNNVAIHKTPYGSQHQGLDLTLASLNAILKYPWPRGSTGKKKKKWGRYSTEQSEFDKVRQLRTPGSRSESMSLEAKIMDWADDLTYAIHDVGDFYQAGLIPLDELVRDTVEREEFVDEFEDQHDPHSNTWDATGFLDNALPRLASLAGRSKTNSMSHILETPFDGTSQERASLSFMASELVERYLGLDSNVNVVVDPSEEGGLDIDPVLSDEVAILHYLCAYYVFRNPALLAQQKGHKKIVKELYEILFNSTEEDSDYRGIIPSPFDEKVELLHAGQLRPQKIDVKTYRARIVADIIASMTEQQAMELYERVTGRSPGLVTDRII
jgi:dGTPase